MRMPGLASALLEPTNLLLLACALIYALIGEGAEAAILLVFVGGISLLDGLQQHRSQRALAELARLSAPRARVLRDGQELELPPELIVPGDGLRLEEGDRVASDGVLEEAVGLWVDTSLLSGEALPVTLLAKWKTVLQIVALGALQLVLLWDGFGLPLEWQPHFQIFAYILIWIAAIVTVWTGWQYFSKARQKMSQI